MTNQPILKEKFDLEVFLNMNSKTNPNSTKTPGPGFRFTKRWIERVSIRFHCEKKV